MFEILELTISDLSRGGAGVARDPNGRVVFVKYTAPGDRIRARITEQEKRYAQAELVEILERSPVRIEPRCPVFGKCGGCQWQHLTYEYQWKTKVQGVLHALKRVQIEVPGLPEERPADQVWNYRNRVQLRGDRVKLGYYAAGSHDIVDIPDCPIARSELNALLPEIRKKGGELPRPYKVELEVFPDGQIQTHWNARHAAGGFRQVHDQQNEKLQDWVSENLPRGGALLDLYGGSGNLSRGIADRFREIHCVDVSSPAGKASNYEFHKQAVAPWLTRNEAMLATKGHWSVILDPPREGLADDFEPIADALARIGAQEIVAVGCDADSWARDVSKFVRRGWQLVRVGVLDLFPQTPHVESLGLLRRAASNVL